jgi:hypothetical protein
MINPAAVLISKNSKKKRFFYLINPCFIYIYIISLDVRKTKTTSKNNIYFEKKNEE